MTNILGFGIAELGVELTQETHLYSVQLQEPRNQE